MVPSPRGTPIIFFVALSMPLRIASGTSFALPSPKPTRPLPSPTMTKALKLNRRPPFTTLATRLMWTTFSFSSAPCASRMTRRGPLEEPGCGMIVLPLELEAALACPLADGAHAAMVEESVPVEDDALDPQRLTAPGDEQADLLGGAHVGRLRELAPEVGRQGRGSEQRLARLVGDQLRVRVLLAPEDAEPPPLVRAAH